MNRGKVKIETRSLDFGLKRPALEMTKREYSIPALSPIRLRSGQAWVG